MIPDGLPDDVGLLVVAGSHAYGLATPESDVDYRGFFQAPTERFLGVHRVEESWVRSDPDIALHEVGKFVRLALDANPTVLEQLVIPDPLIESELARTLRSHFDAFLSDRVRNRFGGYARAQFKRLRDRGDSFSADTRKRTEKHARHMLRLVRQGAELLETGRLTVRLADPGEVFEFGRLPFDEMVAHAEWELGLFDEIVSVLPPEPDVELINEILVGFRAQQLVSHFWGQS